MMLTVTDAKIQKAIKTARPDYKSVKNFVVLLIIIFKYFGTDEIYTSKFKEKKETR